MSDEIKDLEVKPKRTKKKKLEDEDADLALLDNMIAEAIENELGLSNVMTDQEVSLTFEDKIVPFADTEDLEEEVDIGDLKHVSKKRKRGPDGKVEKVQDPTELKMIMARKEKRATAAKYQIINKYKA